MNKLHIITRCTRPQNLKQIRQSIIDGNKEVFNITWYVIFDSNVLKDVDAALLSELSVVESHVKTEYKFMSSSKGAYGYDSINRIVDTIPNTEPFNNEWFYLLDDDPT